MDYVFAKGNLHLSLAKMNWIVCFTPHVNRGTWQWFTFWRPKHQHCFAVRYDTNVRAWLVLECSSQQVNYDVLQKKDADELIRYMVEDCECIEIKVTGKTVYLPRLMYCVSFVKHILGINNIFILTPYHLRCELLKRGGNVIFERLIEEK